MVKPDHAVAVGGVIPFGIGISIATLDFEGRFAIVRSASVEAVSEFKVESLQGQDRLHSLRRNLLELEKELELGVEFEIVVV